MTVVASVFEASFAGSEGRVFYRRWDPESQPSRIVLIVHGYAEHGGRYAHVAAALTSRGSVVYADDHLGHGRSDGERALITDFEHVEDDLHVLAGNRPGRASGTPPAPGGTLDGRSPCGAVC